MMSLPKGINILIQEYLSERMLTDKSISTYRAALGVFVKYLVCSSVCDVRSPQKSDVISWVKSLQDDGKSILTVENYLNTVIFFFRWMAKKEYYHDITKGIRNHHAHRGHRKQHLTIDQTCDVLASLPASSVIEKRNAAIINLLIRTGVRCVEISRMNISDIVPVGVSWAIRIQRKGHKEKDQVIGLPGECVRLIEDYVADRGSSSDVLFINHGYHSIQERLSTITVSRIAVQCLKDHGLKSKQITAHSLRHTAAINALKAGATVYEVMSMLGHTSVNTTQIYLSSIEAETRLVNPAAQHLERYIKEHEKSRKKIQNMASSQISM